MIGWLLEYRGYEPSLEGVREALCTLGNGYFATRGAAPESSADGVHYPGTYIAGCYNRLTSEVAGRSLEHEDLVNAPNWLPLTFRVPGGGWFGRQPMDLLSYSQVLDLERGVLTRDLRVRDALGRVTRVTSRRIVHMGDPHVAALETTLIAENWSGRIEVRSALDGRVENDGVARYRSLERRHLGAVDARATAEDRVLLKVRTVQSLIEIALAARTRIFDVDGPVACARSTTIEDAFIAQDLTLDLHAERPVTIEKLVSLYTSRDRAISECGLAATEHVAESPGFEALLTSHALAWKHLWESFDIELALDQEHEDRQEASQGELGTGVNLRLHVFHLLQTASRHSTDLDVGAGARGLHGEGYRGHVFWDELFVFPFLNYRMPDITRGLLMYRYRRLDAARRAARGAGRCGAMFPWQSGSDGREETPRVYFNPRSRRWIPDHTYLQRHVGAAIVYNVWQYYQVTGDLKFLDVAGAELVLEIARFFADLARWNPQIGRFEIRGVMGPDEYHSAYPDADKPGIDNNTYTNLMAVWVLCRALDVLALLPTDRRRELRELLALGDEELSTWDAISRKMRVVFLESGILAQFEGYDRLEELDWAGLRARYGDIHRLDLILEAEGDTPNRYKASKQPDVLMLFYLFSAEELRTLFDRLGYPFERDAIPQTIDYYTPRTSDGSTLSRVAHSWVLARSNRAASWGLFREALLSDVADIQNGTTREGIHLGAMAGTVDLVQRAYTGLELRDDILWLNPRLPEGVSRLDVLVRYRTHTLQLLITPETIEVSAARCNVPAMRIAVRGAMHVLDAGERRTFSLAQPAEGSAQHTPPLAEVGAHGGHAHARRG